MQQHDYFEQWVNMCHSMNGPITQLAELNMKTFSKIYERNSAAMGNFTNIKKPEEWMNAQTKLAMEANVFAMDYWKEAIDILKDSSSHFTKHCQNAAEAAKSGASAFSGGKGKTTDKMDR